MDAMQKFLEYASAYDDGSDTRIKLKIIHIDGRKVKVAFSLNI